MFLSCCIVYRCVLLFSFSRCRRHSVCQCLLLGRFFSVRLCSSTCIWGVDLILLRFCPHVVSRLCPCFFFILRLRPHILFWGFGLVLYWGFVLIFYFEASASYFIWGFVLIFYIEASSSYFILRLRPRILFWGFVLIFYSEALSSYFILRLRPHILFSGLVLIFYFEASASYFILRLSPHILYRGFVLIFYIEISSSWLIWGFVLIVIYWGYVPQFEALVVIVVGPCCFVCTAYLVCLQWYVCGSVCLFFVWGNQMQILFGLNFYSHF